MALCFSKALTELLNIMSLLQVLITVLEKYNVKLPLFVF